MELYRSCQILLLGAMLLPAVGMAQSSPSESGIPVPSIPLDADTSHCQAIAADDARMAPLAKVCEFSLTYLHELPDFICQQTTTERQGLSGTVLNTQVTFRKGRESYALVSVKVNGKPVETERFARNQAMAFTSGGEFGSFLVDLFKPPIVAAFKFDKEAKLGSTPAVVYEFDVPAGKNSWSVRNGQGHILRPEWRGQLWVERATGRLLKLELQPIHMPANFGAGSIRTTTDYAMTSLGDAGVFVLPVKSETNVCGDPGIPYCVQNVLVFHDCHKFAATTRIVANAPEP